MTLRFGSKDRRSEQRFIVEFPATLLTHGGAKRRETYEAELEDVGPRGARVRIAKRIEPRTEVILDVHCKLPSGNVSTLRFKGTVVRAVELLPFQIAIKFHGKGRFLLDSLDDLLKRAEMADRPKQISRSR